MIISLEVGSKCDVWDFKYKGYFCTITSDGLIGVYSEPDEVTAQVEWFNSFADAIKYIEDKERSL